jgi:hypothetical protein
VIERVEMAKKNLESRVNGTKSPQRSKIRGFEYVPKLGLYVADNLTFLGNPLPGDFAIVAKYAPKEFPALAEHRRGLEATTYYGLKHELKKTGARMLTPKEWWIYYDHCIKKKPDMVKRLFNYNYLLFLNNDLLIL